MSSFNNHGGLWDNQRKFEKTDPDFTGSVTVGGVEYTLAGWMSSSTHPKAPTINLRVGLTKGTLAPVPMDYSKKDDSDDIPF